MNQKMKDLISQSRLLGKPVYTEEDLKILAVYLNIPKDDKCWNVYKQLVYAFNYDPVLFQSWAESYAGKDYDYNAMFFQSPTDRLPLLLAEDLDELEDIVLRWRLERNK